MATDLTLPKLGFSMTEGVLAEWLVADGDQVVEGQVIYALESDKSTQEVEAPAAGTIRITGVPGETYQVGEILGTIE
jgi:pyruvate/2-oxoglutarate dehydrogenase complex dihydrolipoamide acyltransferase (E2) component